MIDQPNVDLQEEPAVVLLSGGQDSTTCLAWALDKFPAVQAVSFDYGQRHAVELVVARRIADAHNVRHQVLDVPALKQIGAAALTNPSVGLAMDATGTGNVYAEEHDLPSSFVPGRNAIFLATAVAYAAPLGIYNLVTGVCEADDAGYPDCRGNFIESIEQTLRLALDEPRVTIYAPLLTLDKGLTFALADQLGALDDVLDMSHTCYEGEHEKRHPWGYGCGECGACRTREKGWDEYQAARSVR